MWQNRLLVFTGCSPEDLDVYCGKLHLSSPSRWLPMWPWASNSSMPQAVGHKIVLSFYIFDWPCLFTQYTSQNRCCYLLCVCTTDSKQRPWPWQELTGDPLCCEKCQDVRNKNNANLSLVSASTLKNLKQYTKQFNKTLDMHGLHVFLYDFLNLCLTWRMEDSGLGFSSIWVFVTLNSSASTADSFWHDFSITWLVSVQRFINH